MTTINQVLEDLELHDGTVHSLTVSWDGIATLAVDLDEVWNRNASPNISGFRFPCVYEVVRYKLDRMNIVGAVEVVTIEDYDRSSVVHDTAKSADTVMVDFDFVAGGRLSLICSDEVEILEEHPNQAMQADRPSADR